MTPSVHHPLWPLLLADPAEEGEAHILSMCAIFKYYEVVKPPDTRES
jgi:hypothetical protein